jgi:hypothetical protein
VNKSYSQQHASPRCTILKYIALRRGILRFAGANSIALCTAETAASPKEQPQVSQKCVFQDIYFNMKADRGLELFGVRQI